ncbi:MAG: glycosyltransferase, partial [Planctomycetes bacterium]|nr:glycosyltransferase [Planctomycetota bacterium]
ESVLAQTYGHFELLVVDDRSPDRTVELAKSIDDPRITVRINETNLGLGNSVLQALASCRTPYVALLNSDDLFHPERLAKCREALLERPSAQMVATGLFVVDAENGRLTTGNTGRLRDGEEVFDWTGWYANAQPDTVDPAAMFGELLSGNFLATSSNLFCRTEFLRAQAEELQQLKYCLDWQLFLEAARTEALVYLPERLASYRLHAANTVWFHEGRRWSYYLEVNRVVSGMVSKFAVERGEEHDSEVLELLVERVVDNPEIDGFALFVNHLLGGADLEHLSENDATVEALVARLNARTEVLTRAFYALRELGRDDVDFGDLRHVPELRVDRILGQLQDDELRSLRGANAWLNEEQNDLKRELSKLRFDLRDTSERADAELDRLSEALTKLAVGLRHIDEEFTPPPASGAHEDLLSRFGVELSRLFELEWRLNRQLEIAQHLEVERQRLEKNLAYAWEQHKESQETLFAERDSRTEERQAYERRIEAGLEQSAAQQIRAEQAERRHAEVESELEHERAVHATLAREHEELGLVHAELEGAFATLREQRAQLQNELQFTVSALAATRLAWREEIQRI